jgi:putative endonuclease
MLRYNDDLLYVGAARGLEGRVKKHNWGVGSRHTAARRPVELIWSEQHPTEQSARSREAEIKGWSREKKQKLIAAQRDREIHPSPEDGSG